MTIFQLKCFVSVESHLSFTKAAEDCHVVQATISRQISSLEEEIGVKLFERDSHGVRTTPAGEMLAHYAPVFLEYQKTIIDQVRNAASSYDRSIRIGVGPYEHILLRNPLRTLHRIFPNIGVNLTSYTYYVLMTRYRNKVLDAALCNELCAAHMTDFRPVEICSAAWKIVASETHPIWSLSQEDQQLMTGQNIITLVDDQFDSVRKYCREHFKVIHFTETNFLTTLFEIVQAGIAIAILPSFAESALPPNVIARDILTVPFVQKFYLMLSPTLSGSDVDMLIELCRSQLSI